MTETTQCSDLGQVRVYSNTVNIWAHHVDDKANREALATVIRTLRCNRFVMRLDREVLKRSRKIPGFCQDYYEGHNGVLNVRANRSGRCVEVEFFVEPRYPNGAWERMGDHNQRRCIINALALVNAAVGIGYRFSDSRWHEDTKAVPNLLTVRDCMMQKRLADPLDRFNAGWTSNRFKRDASGWPCESEYRCDYTRHPGVKAGSTVYTLSNGRLVRGVACPNMNDMWWVETGIGAVWPNGKMLLNPEIPSRPTRDQSKRQERLGQELGKAIAAKDFRRVTKIAMVLERETKAEAAQ